MSFNRFKEVVDAYGSNPAKWPQADQALYAEHAASAQGRVVLAEAERLDHLLSAYAIEETVSPAVAAAIYALPDAAIAVSMRQRSRFMTAFGVSCLVLMLCGFLTGLQAGYDSTVRTSGFDQVTAMIFGAPGVAGVK